MKVRTMRFYATVQAGFYEQNGGLRGNDIFWAADPRYVLRLLSGCG